GRKGRASSDNGINDVARYAATPTSATVFRAGACYARPRGQSRVQTAWNCIWQPRPHLWQRRLSATTRPALLTCLETNVSWVALGNCAIRRAVTRVKSEQAANSRSPRPAVVLP